MESEMTQKAHFRKKNDTLLKKNLAALDNIKILLFFPELV